MYGLQGQAFAEDLLFPHWNNQIPSLESTELSRYFLFYEFMDLNDHAVLATSLQVFAVLCLLDTRWHSRWQEAELHSLFLSLIYSKQ